MKSVFKILTVVGCLSVFSSCAKDDVQNASGSDTSMFQAVKNGKEAHLWAYMPKDSRGHQCWYYAVVH
jgi:hypothetical protein